ncbi:sulfatase-like hydrolase/transferase [Litoreibacter arenae]|uniref:Putative membrane protein n=1 Tax=Litoreibacter arenae DSM 19593 TaxID=1123360 RepID=S9QAV3_9RHOB|nr:sulfatase-like hydrolase/transferase [Litoreibacter arenae]EPX77082.1 putative membrane protein [Litoreibacter arenae DSM 19593]
MKKSISLSVAAGFLFLALVLPNHPGTMNISALSKFPLELPALLFAMIAIGPRRWVIWTLAALVAAVTFLKLADFGMFTAYNRAFNPILDAFLIEAGIGLLSESIGHILAYLAVALGLGFLFLVFLGSAFSLGAWTSLKVPALARGAAVFAALGFGGWAAADAGHHLDYWKFERSPPGTAWTSRLAVKRMVEMQGTAVDLVRFSQEAKSDHFASDAGLLDRLEGRDVILIYIESYGRASFDNPLYAPSHLATLSAGQREIERAGFSMRSGWLTSPTAGGQSWLAHGTLASGLWTSDHGRYNAMLASGHKWLFHFAQEAGYRTAAIMPAITMAWPESSKMGFELVFAAADIPYKGDRFNWVTMPDQFTLATYPTLLPDDRRPDFVQIALISSHAPWVPVPEMVEWDKVGDGTIFNEMAARGPTPRELWKNRDDVREAYRKAIDYSLQATFSHVARLGEEAPLVVVVGDHQAAGFVAGSDNRDVPVHMIGPADVIARVDSWGWTDGLIPQAEVPARRMDTFRDNFLSAFSEPTKLVGAVQ